MRLLIAVFVLLFAVPAFAQTNPVQAGQAFNVAFDHDGQNVTSFQCGVDGKPSGTALPATSRLCVIPGQAAGSHSITVTAINSFGVATSVPLVVTAGSAPSAPGNLRLSLTIAQRTDGSFELLAFNVEKAPAIP